MSRFKEIRQQRLAQNNSKLSDVQRDTNYKRIRIEDAGGTVPTPKKSNMSPLWKALDLIDRPANALRVGFNNAMIGKDFTAGLKDGITGKQRVFGSELLGSAGMDKGAARSIAGFGVDVLLDPLLFAGAPVKGAAKGVQAASKTGGLINKAAGQVVKDGLLSSTVKAPFKIVDDGLTRAGVSPALKARQIKTNNPLVKAVEAVGNIGGSKLGKGYVHAADMTGNFRPNYVPKNYDPNLARQVYQRGSKIKINSRSTTPAGKLSISLAPKQLDYDTGRKYLQQSAKAANTAKRKAETAGASAIREYAENFGNISSTDQILIREHLEDLPIKLEQRILDLDTTGKVSVAKELNTLARMPMTKIIKKRKYVKTLGAQLSDQQKYIADNAQLLMQKAQTSGKPISIQSAQNKASKMYDKSYSKWINMDTALAEFDAVARASAKDRAAFVANNPELGALAKQARNRFGKMAEKEGLSGNNRMVGYVPRYAEGAQVLGSGVTPVKAGGSAEIKKLMSQSINAHKKRGYISTQSAIDAGKQTYRYASDVAQDHLKKQGVDIAARETARKGVGSKFAKVQEKLQKATAAGDTFAADAARREIGEMARKFTVDDMVEAIGRGLNPNDLPPVFHVAETFGEAWIQREIQHSTLVASQRLLDDLVAKGTAIKKIPNAKAQYDAKVRAMDNMTRGGALLSPADQKLFNQLQQEAGALHKYLGTTRQFVNAGDLGLKGADEFMVHPQVAQTVTRMSGSFAMTKELSEVRKLYKGVLGHFKQSVTGMNPGWYVTNLVGNVYNAYLGGVTDLNRYRIAALAQADTPASRQVVSEYLKKNNVPSIKALKQAQKKGIKNPPFVPMSAEEFHKVFTKEGLSGFGTSWDNLGVTHQQIARQSAIKARREPMSLAGKAADSVRTAAKVRTPKDAYSGVMDASRNLADAMETNAKVTVFLDDLIKQTKKMKNPTYSQMKAQSAKSREHALKYLFDYSDVTHAETMIKDAIPFYTFQRKNIPLQIEHLLKSPEKFAQFHRLREGTLQEEYSQEQMDKMPEWLRGKAIALGGGKMITPALPSESLDDMFSPRAMAGMLTPALTKPLELVTNQNFFTGAPIENYEGEKKKSMFGEISPQLRHLLDTFGYTRNLNTAVQEWDNDKEKAVNSFVDTPDPFTQALLRAVGRTYNPEVNDLNYEYGVDRQLADAIKALKASGVDVRTATEILKNGR